MTNPIMTKQKHIEAVNALSPFTEIGLVEAEYTLVQMHSMSVALNQGEQATLFCKVDLATIMYKAGLTLDEIASTLRFKKRTLRTYMSAMARWPLDERAAIEDPDNWLTVAHYRYANVFRDAGKEWQAELLELAASEHLPVQEMYAKGKELQGHEQNGNGTSNETVDMTAARRFLAEHDITDIIAASPRHIVIRSDSGIMAMTSETNIRIEISQEGDDG